MILTLVILVPLIGGLLILFVPRERESMIKALGIGVSAVTLVMAGLLYGRFDPATPGMQFTSRLLWIPGLNVSFSIGLDGLSLLLVLLTAFLVPVAMLSSWDSIPGRSGDSRVKEYTFMLLLLETGMIGVFCALDLFLFYIFWEAMLVPMYFLIGIWGGERKIYAAFKFFLYTMAGSMLMLVAIIVLGYEASLQPDGKFTTDLAVLYRVGPGIPFQVQSWLFLAFALSFAIKIPLFPFHTWLPDAHVEAPTAGSVLLAGILLKMGAYGFLRFCLPLFPQSAIAFMPLIATLAVIGIVYGALLSMVQTDIKKLVAYSSVSHLGFVVLGIFSLTEEGVQGSILQMVNHGLSTGALFLIVGMIYARRHTRTISEFGGLAKVMPVLATLFMIVMLSSIGLPGLNGFIGEFLILVGSFRSPYLSPWYTVFAATGVILAAVYLLTMYQRVMLGAVSNPANRGLRDLSKREIAVLVPVLVFIVWIGVYPAPFLERTAGSARQIISTVQPHDRASVASRRPDGPAPSPK